MISRPGVNDGNLDYLAGQILQTGELAQLDRVSGYGLEGCRFEPCIRHQVKLLVVMRAKFEVQSVTLLKGMEQIVAQPVYGNGEENKSFSQHTPVGKLELTITNTAAFGFYKPGRSYYIDITEAPEDAVVLPPGM